MFHEGGLPEKNLSFERLTKEAQILLGAGPVSTARTLHFITFHLWSNPHIREQLELELKDTGERATWSQLEKPPYLQALVEIVLR